MSPNLHVLFSLHVTASRSDTEGNSAASKLGTHSGFLLVYTSAGEAEPTI